MLPTFALDTSRIVDPDLDPMLVPTGGPILAPKGDFLGPTTRS